VTRTRSLILLILAIFAVYIIVRNPTESAAIMRQGITAVGNTLQALGTFFSELFSG
jgi:Ca2+/Na+ antiporter